MKFVLKLCYLMIQTFLKYIVYKAEAIFFNTLISIVLAATNNRIFPTTIHCLEINFQDNSLNRLLEIFATGETDKC